MLAARPPRFRIRGYAPAQVRNDDFGRWRVRFPALRVRRRGQRAAAPLPPLPAVKEHFPAQQF